MDVKRRLFRCLARMTCDKAELHRLVLKYRKRFREACEALKDR